MEGAHNYYFFWERNGRSTFILMQNENSNIVATLLTQLEANKTIDLEVLSYDQLELTYPDSLRASWPIFSDLISNQIHDPSFALLSPQY